MNYYYLHINGDLIHKRYCPDYSDFVKKIWSVDLHDRYSAWVVILEALALGGNLARIKELSNHWKCDLKDLVQFLTRVKTPNKLLKVGVRIFIEDISNVNYNKWMDWLSLTPKGKEPDYLKMPKGV